VLTSWVERPNTPDEPRRDDTVATRTAATMSARRMLTFDTYRDVLARALAETA